MGRVSRWICSIFCKSTKDHKTYKPKPITTNKSRNDNNRDNVSVFAAADGDHSGRRIAREVESASQSSTDYASVDEYSHAMAVAAATATAAEAAVMAAHAAVEVVRLTRSGRLEFDPSHRAAVLIQSAFRGYLARRALRALRALVRLQALVRGNIVRKRTVEQMRKMHALLMAQKRARAIRAPAPPSISYSSSKTSYSSNLDTSTPGTSDYSTQARISGNEQSVKSKLQRKISRVNRSPSKTYSARFTPDHFDEETIDRIVGVGVGSAEAYVSTKNKNSFPAKQANPYQTPSRYSPEEDIYIQFSNEIDQHTFYTANSSPRRWIHTDFSKSRSGRRRDSITSDYPESYLGAYPDLPNYMAYTKSSKAKLRSSSAPKQRTQLERATSLKCYSTRDFNLQRLSPSLAR